jgi:hypothetical protein
MLPPPFIRRNAHKGFRPTRAYSHSVRSTSRCRKAASSACNSARTRPSSASASRRCPSNCSSSRRPSSVGASPIAPRSSGCGPAPARARPAGNAVIPPTSHPLPMQDLIDLCKLEKTVLKTL